MCVSGRCVVTIVEDAGAGKHGGSHCWQCGVDVRASVAVGKQRDVLVVKNVSPRPMLGKCGCTSKREVGPSMANNKRGPEPGSQKAKHGGQAVREKYGAEFYARIGRKGGETVKEKRGPRFYAEIGKKGGESTKRQQGAEFYSKIGKKGGERGRSSANEATAAEKE
jgi:general stress protein YciG